MVYVLTEGEGRCVFKPREGGHYVHEAMAVGVLKLVKLE